MSAVLGEVEWGEPVLPIQRDAAWEEQVKRRGGHVSEADRRTAASPWIRELGLSLTTYKAVAMPAHLLHIGAMVVAQENACRYCYGANRAYLKLLGYSEAYIRRLEREVHEAELDERDRVVIAFARNLARSRPRPSRSACQALVDVGLSPAAVAEVAFLVAVGCFYNRVTTFMACPPERGFERFANGPVGRIVGLGAALLRSLKPGGWGGQELLSAGAAKAADGPFGPILAPLAGLPAERIMKDALEGAFASPVLSRPTKALMFAIVARTLECALCENQARGLLDGYGIQAQDVDSALAQLHSDQLPGAESALLSWTRGTVYYDVANIQRETRELAGKVDPKVLLEAIGVAALANATVRLAMLHA